MKQKHTLRNFILVVLVLAIAGGYYYVTSGKNAAVMFNEVTANKRDIETYYTFTGNVTPDSSYIQTASGNGTVESIWVEEGDTVSEGDAIFVTTSGTTVKAPMDGTVSNLYIEVDQQFSVGTQLYRLADYAHPKLKIKVDEYDVFAIEKGMKVTVKVHALDQQLEGTVVRIAQEATVANEVAYYEAVIELPQDGTLRMGMTCEVIVQRESAQDVVAVPVDVIQYDDNGKPYVYCYNRNDEVVTQNVLLGINDGIYVEVISGIVNGETILKPKSALESLPMMQMMQNR